jgi:hypothetical protein
MEKSFQNDLSAMESFDRFVQKTKLDGEIEKKQLQTWQKFFERLINVEEGKAVAEQVGHVFTDCFI